MKADFSRYDNIPYGPFLEDWRDVVGFEGIYLISNYGNVKSVSRPAVTKCQSIRVITEKYLKKEVVRKGYYRIRTSKNGVKGKLAVHRMVAMAFIPNPENKPEVNHIRGFTNDNVFTQLEWNTRKENAVHAIQHLHLIFQKTPTRKPVTGVNVHTNEPIHFKMINDTTGAGFNSLMVRKAIRANQAYKNYNWSYDKI